MGGRAIAMIKLPIQLVKGLADGPDGEDRFQIAIPPDYAERGQALRSHKGEFFVLIGPCDEAEVKAIIGGE